MTIMHHYDDCRAPMLWWWGETCGWKTSSRGKNWALSQPDMGKNLWLHFHIWLEQHWSWGGVQTTRIYWSQWDNYTHKHYNLNVVFVFIIRFFHSWIWNRKRSCDYCESSMSRDWIQLSRMCVHHFTKCLLPWPAWHCWNPVYTR